MAKYHAGKSSKWEKLPFTIGREGPEFLPGNFGEKRASGPKTVPSGSVGGGTGSGTRLKRKKSVPHKVK